jgi:hypothetical protein
MMYAVVLTPSADTIGPFDDRAEAEAVAYDEAERNPDTRAEVIALSDDEALDLLIADEDILEALYPLAILEEMTP